MTRPAHRFAKCPQLMLGGSLRLPASSIRGENGAGW